MKSWLLVFSFALVMLAASGMEAQEVSESLTFPESFERADFERLLHKGHPRLFATEERWEEVAQSLENSVELQNMLAALRTAADALEKVAPRERVMTGRRLLSVSREVLRRVMVLGSVYRLTGEERYFERARVELLNAAAFSDWNPSHFLDVAEMTLGLAVGYDWLYDELSEKDRQTLRNAILEKGLRPGMKPLWWKKSDNNWNQVCFAGMVAGALAIGDHEPDLAVHFLREAFSAIHLPLDAYRPDGAYPEGPGYWNYGTHFQVVLLSVLQSALGETWNLENYPAFQESAVYINLMVGPSGKFFNYADGSESVSAMPALHWFASQAGNPTLDARERAQLTEVGPALLSSARRGRLFALSLLWFDPELGKKKARPLPLHWRAGGPNPVAVHRSSWDSEAWFVGIKGGSPAVNHGHMDIGSFVLDWQGERWAMDLGAQNYGSLESLGLKIWNPKQESDRWRVFRLSNLSHNILVIDQEPQLVDEFAPIQSFSEEPSAAFTVIDMTPVYQKSLERAIRGVRIGAKGGVLLEDEITGLAPGKKVRWGMVTPAEIELKGNEAVLRKGGKQLFATIVSPTSGAFEVVSINPPPSDFDVANPGTRMLAFFLDGSSEPLSIQVVFSAEPLAEEEVREFRSQTAPGKWRPTGKGSF